MLWEAQSNTQNSVSSDKQTLRSWLPLKLGCASFFSTHFSVFWYLMKYSSLRLKYHLKITKDSIWKIPRINNHVCFITPLIANRVNLNSNESVIPYYLLKICTCYVSFEGTTVNVLVLHHELTPRPNFIWLKASRVKGVPLYLLFSSVLDIFLVY